MNKQQPGLILVIGCKGSGKTYYTKGMLEDSIKGDPSTGAKPRKALIIDVNGEFIEYKTISLRDVGKFTKHPKVEIRRLTTFKDDGKILKLNEIAEMLNTVLENYKNGTLLVEDLTVYISDSLPKDVIGAICRQRHMGVYMILHFQMLGKAAHPKLIANANWIRLHHCTTLTREKMKNFGDYTDAIMLAQILVNDEYNKREKSRHYNRKDKKVYFCAWINLDNQLIIGDFDKAMLADAIHEFINQNERETIGVYLKKKDKTGKTLYNWESAYKAVERDMMLKYYGNKN
jgi:hypothetical protein